MVGSRWYCGLLDRCYHIEKVESEIGLIQKALVALFTLGMPNCRVIGEDRQTLLSMFFGRIEELFHPESFRLRAGVFGCK